jgi:hypothetical protein
MTDEMQTRAVGACWQFAAVFHATSYPAKTPVNKPAQTSMILLEKRRFCSIFLVA